MHWRRKWQPTPVFLPGESQGQRSLVGCHLWGRTESDTTEAMQQQQQQVFSRVRNTQRFTELGREDKGEGGDRGNLVEKKSPKGERVVKPVIILLSKNGY